MRARLHREEIDPERVQRLVFWARSYLEHTGEEDPGRLDRETLEGFLDHLVRNRYAGRPTQDRALDAVHWLYRSMPDGTPPWLQRLLDERRRTAGPNIVTRAEVQQLLARLRGDEWLAAALVYGTGIRLIECLRLRVRDVDPDARRLTMRGDDDQAERVLVLPAAVAKTLGPRLDQLKQEHIRDIGNGGGAVTLPPELARAQPGVELAWSWQYLFPQRLENTASERRDAIHHLEPTPMHRAFAKAARATGIHRRVTGHLLRNSHAVHLIQHGAPVARVEQLLGLARGGDSKPVIAPPHSCIELPDPVDPSPGLMG
jgi:site-specific recombinase XerD